MPISAYDYLFGGKGDAQTTLDAMKKRYGDKKGTSVFYALAAKRKRVKGGKSKG